ncbi:sciellin [Nelusetta ayraudi]|uniref:sciellin n=1 Tax=Nelusetta ayraudi TaxID=303726 RepID=UPI003F6ED49F
MSRFSSRNTVMKDTSWIKRGEDEDEAIDDDPNFGKSILSKRSDQTPRSPETTGTFQSGTSVGALSKRFGGRQDEVDNSTLPSGRRSSSTNRSSIGDPNSRTTTTTVTKDGSTTTTTTKTLRSSVTSPTQTFTERVLSSSRTSEYAPYSTKTKVTERTESSLKDAEDQVFDTLVSSPTKQDYSPTDSKTVTTTETVTVRSTSDKYAEDKLYDSLIPAPLKDDYTPMDRETSVYSTQSVTVRSSTNGGDYKTVTTRTSSSMPEDELYSTLIPATIKSPASIKRKETVEVESSKGWQSPTLSSPSSSRTSISYSSYPDDMSTTTRTTSYTISSKPSYEYGDVSSSPSYSSSLYRSRSEELLSDPVYPKSSSYRNSIVLEKDLCTHCRKPFNGEAKMILDDMKINCHASCFKCAVCNGNLSHMRAGDSLWVYRKMVHCENCFDITREKWKR